MSRVDAYIAQVEEEKRKRRWFGGARRGTKARFALAYMLCLSLFVVLVETVGESLPILGPAIQSPMAPLLVVPMFGIVLALVRKSGLGVVFNLVSIALSFYMLNPVWFKGARDPSSATLTVSTFNIQHLEAGKPECLLAIKEAAADVILLQEASPLATDSEFRKAAFEGYQILLTGHLAIASRFPVDDLREVRFGELLDFDTNKEVFSPNPEDHGVAQIAKIRWSGQSVYFVNVHLAPNAYSREQVGWLEQLQMFPRSFAYRMAQIGALRSELAKLDGPIIWGGDFNNPPMGNCYRAIRDGFADSWREVGIGYGWTIHSKRPYNRIDYLLSNSFWRPLRADVGGEIGSDHRSYKVVFELAKPWKLEEGLIPSNIGTPSEEPPKEEPVAAPKPRTPSKFEIGPTLAGKPLPGPIKPAATAPNAAPKKPVAKPAPKKKAVVKRSSKRSSSKRRPVRRRRG